MQSPYLVDSHCHIPLIENGWRFGQRDQGGARGRVGHILCVSIDLVSFPEIKQLADTYPCISASAGVHPNSAREIELSEKILLELADDPTVVAIGETGLDYFRSQGDLDWQRHRFRIHIRAAREINKPLIIHSREARGDVIKILAEEGAQR